MKAQFVLRASDLHNAKANMKVLHPLPRVDEIATDVDKTPHAWVLPASRQQDFRSPGVTGTGSESRSGTVREIEMTHDNKLQVEAIKRGTVIDHIPAQIGFKLLSLFKLTETDQRITIGLNLPSGEMGRKDLIKSKIPF